MNKGMKCSWDGDVPSNHSRRNASSKLCLGYMIFSMTGHDFSQPALGLDRAEFHSIADCWGGREPVKQQWLQNSLPELFQLFALPSSCCQRVSVPSRSSSCCPSNSPRNSGDTSSASVAEENPVPMGLLAAAFGSRSIWCCLARGQLKPLSISLAKF